MSSASACDRQARRRLLLEEGGPNGFDHVEVVGAQGVPEAWRQRLLRAFFLRPLTDDIGAERLVITGGDRIPEVDVVWALAWPLLAEFRAFVDSLDGGGISADDLLDDGSASETVLTQWVTHLADLDRTDDDLLVGVDWQARLGDDEQKEAFVERFRRVIEDPIFGEMVTDAGPMQWSEVEQIVGDEDSDTERLLVLRTGSQGDYSTYNLRLVTEASGDPQADGQPARLDGYDPVLSDIEVFFKIECSPDADCRPPAFEAERPRREPRIDYMARDYASFRRLMLDRLSSTMPQWQDRSPADVGVALVETMAYVADQLSYYQDAVATEAYLDTARRRASVRRHARLVDYFVHEGANARALVHMAVKEGQGHAPLEMAGPWHTPDAQAEPVRFLSRCPGLAAGVDPADFPVVYDKRRPEVFELVEPAYLSEHHNEITIYDWKDPNYTLGEGATSAALKVGQIDETGDPAGSIAQPLQLRPGDLVVFEQVQDPQMGPEVADPARRQVVRLTAVSPAATLEADEPGARRISPTEPEYRTDWATGARFVEVEWAEEDALEREIPVARQTPAAPQPGEGTSQTLAVARANIALADHGRTVTDEPLLPVESRPYRPRLEDGPVTHAAAAPDPTGPVREALQASTRKARPVVRLRESDSSLLDWQPRVDLLASGSLDREFVVEVDSHRQATLRFGDGMHGARPIEGRALLATYRVGNGRAGNLPAEAIAHVVGAPLGIARVSNPVAARGGVDPEPLEQVRQLAPHAFRRQERAVTEEDYAQMVERHPQVQRAVASRRFTGSWSTIFVSVDRVGGLPVDRAFEEELVDFLEQFRLAGDDVEIEPPRMVPVEIRMTVCVERGYYRSHVERALERRFSTRVFSDGTRGFFHPDNFSFGEPLYLSAVVAAAMEVAGVSWVDLDPGADGRRNTFKARSRPRLEAYEAGKIEVSCQEVIRLDNDPNHRELGTIAFDFEGGR